MQICGVHDVRGVNLDEKRRVIAMYQRLVEQFAFEVMFGVPNN